MLDLNFYKDKTVLVTGHTGFKGTWLCKMLLSAGAKVIGYALNPPTDPNLFVLSGIESRMVSVIGDIRDFRALNEVFDRYQPECVLHLAAQPLVRDSYKMPKYTYETNVLGTVNVLECVRLHSCVKSFLNVTTDKVYRNDDLPDHPSAKTSLWTDMTLIPIPNPVRNWSRTVTANPSFRTEDARSRRRERAM